MSADILAYRNGDPVSAAPPSTFYALSKTLQKYRKTVIAVCTVSSTLLLVSIAGSILAYNNYQKSVQLAELNHELQSTIVELKDAKGKIQRDAETAQYRSAIAIALNSFDHRLQKQMPAPQAAPEPESGDTVVPQPKTTFETGLPISTAQAPVLLELSSADLLQKALKPIKESIERTPRLVVQTKYSPQILKLVSRVAIASRTPFYRRLVLEYQNAFGNDDSHVSEAMNLFAASLLDDGRLEEAESTLHASMLLADEVDRTIAMKLLATVKARISESK